MVDQRYPWQQGFRPMQQASMPVQQPQPTRNRITVNSIEEAKYYHVAPNTSIDMWDVNLPVIYVKYADAYGNAYMDILDYSVRNDNQQQKEKQQAQETPEPIYATKDDVASLRERVNKLSDKVKELIKSNERTEQPSK